MFFKEIIRIGRRIIYLFCSSTLIFPKMILSNLLMPRLSGCLHIILPALLYGCSGEIQSNTSSTFTIIKHNIKKSESTLDIFTFENDRLQRLDAYQRLDHVNSNTIPVSSTGGDKIFFLCINGQRNRYDWGMISSYSSLQNIFCNLEYESLEKRTMTAGIRATAGGEISIADATPLTSEVIIERIGCDFSGTAYSKSVIQNLRVYLTNVCASCPILYNEEYKPNRIINTAALNSDDIRTFLNPEIISQEITEQLGMTTIQPDISLLCYPNPAQEESPGSPHTRLVLEGVIDSQTYYWPITIAPDRGVGRGNRYVYDILIRRKGVTDPDTPIDGKSIDIQLRTKPWTEKEEYSVDF